MKKYSGMLWGEGIRWRDGALWLSDTQGSKLWTDASGEWRSIPVPSPSNGLWFLPDGRLVAAMMHERRIGMWTGSEWGPYADLSHLDVGPVGDLIGDEHGNLYVDDVAYSLHKGEQPRPGRLIFVSADRSAHVAADDVAFPNGLAFLDGGRTLVAAETTAKRLVSFQVDAPGKLSRREVFADLAELVSPEAAPDGLWGTAEGVWVCTLYAHKIVLISKGKVVRTIDTGDTLPVACCTDESGRLFATLADTAGQSLMDAIANKTISVSVHEYDREQ
ncbi:SMP-30/gluconolactonase/LRE family protein [Sphingobium subterraneum]|uniref:Sugar lactone lactonase YvrE n=1 Tax=Sphingobium subterraneum TaxID=627688 RepID=A0A841J336_9SPHN|nr:SMP-30/gluconolactonase/LRE family protein [Sphingobium subterraneum]MBB6125227.1 sugar lactone lactonase YvrE [Sphingobium subterraneum]